MELFSNPFITTGYQNKDYFCDREKELDFLSKRLKNEVNVTLISARRFGKTALIYRFFEEIEAENSCICIYSDMYATQSLKDFTEILVKAVLRKIPEKKSVGRRFMKLLKSFQPVITYDPLTGQPEIRFQFASAQECERTLDGIFRFLSQQNSRILVAIDEFQQIAYYPEGNVEAVLRTIIQTLKNIHFIFCGSDYHMMMEIFNNAKRPFFSSTQLLQLGPVPEKSYADFIHRMFALRKRTITEEAVAFILDWTRRHTYYTQIVCNNVFAAGQKNTDIADVKKACSEILSTHQSTFIQFRYLLGPAQWNLLIAIAKEDKVYQPQAKTFLQKYQLGAATVRRALEALVEKAMVYRSEEENKICYQVYDVFLSRWLQLTF